MKSRAAVVAPPLLTHEKVDGLNLYLHRKINFSKLVKLSVGVFTQPEQKPSSYCFGI